ncbi:MAG: DUF2066 domain-containing protein [Pseudomonadota bacterium]
MKRWIVMLTGLVLTMTAAAVDMPDLYTVTVPWEEQRRDGRELAYAAALDLVLRRMTPNTGAAWRKADLAPASRFVLGYRESGASALLVSFDGAAVTAALQEAGIPVWGSDRPLTLAWIAVEDETGERQLVAARALAEESPFAREVRAALTEAASLHGLPLRLPILDDTDRGLVTDSDIWGGFVDRIRGASQRYGAQSVLIGRITAAAPERARWSWSFAGDNSSFGAPVVDAVQRMSGEFLRQFATEPGLSEDVLINVVGIDSMLNYGRVTRLLNSQSLIGAVDVVAMEGDAVTFRIDALASRQRLGKLLDGDVLESVAVATLPGGAADLFFRVRALEMP